LKAFGRYYFVTVIDIICAIFNILKCGVSLTAFEITE